MILKEVTYQNYTLSVPERYLHDNLTKRFDESIYEKEETYLCKKYFNNNDNVLELGSCLGYIACILSKQCKNVVSIEGNPELKQSLDRTKILNNLENVIFINGYLDTVKTTHEFQTYDNIVAGSGDREDLVINNVRGWGNTLKLYNVNTITLDEIQNIDNINGLVMDIEGGELKILTDFSDFIKNKINKICIELHGHLMKDKKFDEKCIKKIISLGFKLKERVGISYYFEK